MKHFLLAMATLWCVASTFSSFAADNNKWKPLFGKNLENANYNPEVWSETDGVLGAVKDESIWTKDEYENFELDLDFKTDVGTNSGVVVYCTDTKDWIPNSVEIQIADDHCEKWGNGKPYEKCGAIYGHLGAVQDKVVKKPGEWNHMRPAPRTRMEAISQVGCPNLSPNYRPKDLSDYKENMEIH